jgi:hypothetical protein
MHGHINVSTFIEFEWPYASVELAHAIYWHRKPRFRSFGERADLTTGTAPESTLNHHKLSPSDAASSTKSLVRRAEPYWRHHSGLAGWITFVPAFCTCISSVRVHSRQF